jgi:hypothetical protein
VSRKGNSAPSLFRFYKERVRLTDSGTFQPSFGKRDFRSIFATVRVLVEKPVGRRPLGRPRRRWDDNIRMDLREVGMWTGWS